MPSLLFLTQRIPYPPIKGEKIRPLQMLRHLAASYDVHLGCLVDDPRDQEHVPTVQALCATSYFATLDRKRAKIACLTGLLTGEPLSVTFYRDRGLAEWVKQTIRTVRPDVLFICSSNMAPYVLDIRGSERVRLVDLADVDSEKWRSYAETGRAADARRARARGAAGRQARGPDRPGMRLEHLRLRRGGRACSPACSRTAPDGSAPWSAAWTASISTRRPPTPAPMTRRRPPTSSPAPWTTSRMRTPSPGSPATILPLIRQTEPAAQFYIVGSSPSPARPGAGRACRACR